MLTNAQHVDVPLPVPRDAREARAQLEQIACALFLDGRLTRAERGLLRRYASRFDLSAADVKLIERETRSRLYREAQVQTKGSA